MENLDIEIEPKVSIIIPVYNGSNYLKDAIESALAQTYKNIEVIVVNDGSSDHGATAQVALSYGNCIRYFEKANGGVASALNLGIEKMEGEYFSWLSHDDMYLPDKIQQEIFCLKKLKDPSAIVAEGYKTVDANGKYIATVNLHKQYTEDKLGNPLFVLMRGGIQACALLIHKSHFERAGLFDTKLKTTQDLDLCFRVLREQHFYYAPFSNVLVRGHKDQGSKQNFELHIQECNRLWIRMMEEISPQEKKSFGESEFDFYQDLWAFLETTSYVGAARYAQYKMFNAAIETYQKEGKEKDLGLVCRMFGIPKSRLLKKGEFSIKHYQDLRHSLLWKLTVPARFLQKWIFLLRKNHLYFIVKKIIRMWKRDGAITTVRKLGKRLAGDI